MRRPGWQLDWGGLPPYAPHDGQAPERVVRVDWVAVVARVAVSKASMPSSRVGLNCPEMPRAESLGCEELRSRKARCRTLPTGRGDVVVETVCSRREPVI